jgi:hypothetical protein
MLHVPIGHISPLKFPAHDIFPLTGKVVHHSRRTWTMSREGNWQKKSHKIWGGQFQVWLSNPHILSSFGKEVPSNIVPPGGQWSTKTVFFPSFSVPCFWFEPVFKKVRNMRI